MMKRPTPLYYATSVPMAPRPYNAGIAAKRGAGRIFQILKKAARRRRNCPIIKNYDF
jgi:hypothetical protein